MGIKGINQLLKRECGDVHISRIPMKSYAGRSIAVDAAMYICAFKCRPNYLESLIELFTKFRECRINALFVFDGEAPDEKRSERASRASKKTMQYNRIEQLEADLLAYTKTSVVSNALNEINSSSKIRQHPLIKHSFNYREVADYVKKLRSTILRISERDFDQCRELLDMFGFQYLTAPGEGEFYCAELLKLGLVDEMITKDTDALACLAPRVITGIEGDCFVVVTLSQILEKMGLDEASWVDLCIMCGTDFNMNIPRIGPVKAYALIKAHRSIDEIGKSKGIDISILNHTRIRQLFATSNISGDDSLRPNIQSTLKDVDFDALVAFIFTESLSVSPSRLRKRMKISVVVPRTPPQTPPSAIPTTTAPSANPTSSTTPPPTTPTI